MVKINLKEISSETVSFIKAHTHVVHVCFYPTVIRANSLMS